MNEDGFRLLRDGAGTTTLPAHTVVRVSGGDPRAFLDAVLSQDLSGLHPGRGALACLLDDRGHVLSEVRVLMLEDAALLDGEPEARAALTGWLARVAPLSGCAVTDESEGWSCVAVRGAAAGGALGPPLPDREHAFVARDAVLIVRVEWGLPGFDVLSPGSPPRLEVAPVGLDAFEAVRIATGRPRFGLDFTKETLVNETPLLARAVSFAKGCYPGQESVARVHNLGHARRALVGLDIQGTAPSPGAPVLVPDGAEVGRLTSVAAVPGGAAAIALLRAEIAPGTLVVVEGRHATVRALG